MLMLWTIKLLLRFFYFSIKVTVSCIVVLVLQTPVGTKTVEQWIEGKLKHSPVSRIVQSVPLSFAKMIQEKFPGLQNNNFESE